MFWNQLQCWNIKLINITLQKIECYTKIYFRWKPHNLKFQNWSWFQTQKYKSISQYDKIEWAIPLHQNNLRWLFTVEARLGLNLIGALFRNNCVMSKRYHFIDFYIVIGSYVLVKFCLSFASLDCVRPVRPSISPIPKPINVKGNQGTSK